jgi:uncharacterized surface protein with fasciclin (FAS1) repeats
LKRWITAVVVVLVVAAPRVLGACGDEDEGAGGTSPSPTPSGTGAPREDLADSLTASGLTTLAAAAETAGLSERLRGEGPYTVFAPTDAAFGDLPSGLLMRVLRDPGLVGELAGYHLVEGEVRSTDLTDGTTLTTVQGDELAISVRDGAAYVNDVLISTPDLEASNGVIHVIDEVLLPPGLAES